MIINFLAFQAGWFGAVLSAAAGRPLIGLAIMTAAVALHLFRNSWSRGEILLVITCGAIGGAWDSVLVAAGWVGYDTGMLLSWLAPYWIIAMWMLFATTLNESLGWLRDRNWLAVLFGAVGGPLAYYTGAGLGAINLLDPVMAYAALAIGWALLLPLLLRIATPGPAPAGNAPRRRGWMPE